MKKLLIGCGILVLLLLGGLGYVVWKIGPAWTEAFESIEQVILDLQALDEEHPFDIQAAAGRPLDADRFAAALDIRVQVQREIAALEERMHAIEEKVENEELGFWSTLFTVTEEALGSLLPPFETLVPSLASARMGPTEFAWHMRVLWAAIESVEAGVGDEALSPLVGRYPELERTFADMRRENPELPTLDETIGVVEAEHLSTAREVMAGDVARVEAGLGEPAIEFFFLRLDDVVRGELEAGPNVTFDIETGHESGAEPSGTEPAPSGG